MDKKNILLLLLAVMPIFGCSFHTSINSSNVFNKNLSKENFNSILLEQIFPKPSETENLTLAQALALTLEKNPDLKSFAYSVRTGEARIIQAGLIPNPDLSLQIEDLFGPYGNNSYSQLTLQLSQVIELGGKRSARINSAAAFRDQLQDDYEIKRIEILSSLADKFIRTVADYEILKIVKNSVNLTKQALQAIKRRSQAGGISELAEIKAKILVSRLQIASEHAEHEFQSSKKELSAFWGEENPKFAEIKANIFEQVALPTFEELSSRVDQSPEIRKWATEKRLREAEKKLADSKAIPNLTLGAGPRRLEHSNNDSWVFQFSVPLAVFDRNQGERKEAEIVQDKVDIDMEAARLRLKTVLFALYQEAKHAQAQLEVMKQEIIPQAKQSLKIAQDGYNQGSFSYFDLVDAQRTLLEVSRENIEAAYSFHSFIHSIERLLGSPLSDKSKTN